MPGRHTFRHAFATLIGGLLISVTAHAQSILYLTDGDSSRLQAVDVTTGTLLYTTTTSSLAYPIAVRETVSLGNRDTPGLTGNYDLATGQRIGVTPTPTSASSWSQALDGAAGVNVNYVLQWNFSSPGTVYQTNLNWENEVALFQATDPNIFGLAYNFATSTLWLAGASTIYEYSLTGTLLSQFTHTGGESTLAYQGSTNSLWIVPNDSNDALLQYSASGTLLNTVTVAGRSGNIYGAEFQAIPEPSTYALLALGGGLLIFINRRRFRRG